MSEIKLKKFDGKYPQCIFCYGKDDIFEMSGKGTLAVSICKTCLDSLHEQANEDGDMAKPVLIYMML